MFFMAALAAQPADGLRRNHPHAGLIVGQRGQKRIAGWSGGAAGLTQRHGGKASDHRIVRAPLPGFAPSRPRQAQARPPASSASLLSSPVGEMGIMAPASSEIK